MFLFSALIARHKDIVVDSGEVAGYPDVSAFSIHEPDDH
jgi:hypothetical protein